MWAHEVVKVQYDQRAAIVATLLRLFQLVLRFLQRPRLAVQLELLAIDDLIVVYRSLIDVDAAAYENRLYTTSIYDK